MNHQIIQQAHAAWGYAVVRGADGTRQIVPKGRMVDMLDQTSGR